MILKITDLENYTQFINTQPVNKNTYISVPTPTDDGESEGASEPTSSSSPPAQGSGVPGGETPPIGDSIAEQELEKYTTPGSDPTSDASSLPGGTTDPIDPYGGGGANNSTGWGASTPDGGLTTWAEMQKQKDLNMSTY